MIEISAATMIASTVKWHCFALNGPKSGGFEHLYSPFSMNRQAKSKVSDRLHRIVRNTVTIA
jgi:hypothetical protein